MTYRYAKVVAVLVVVVLAVGCAAGRAFRRGETAARLGDWDAAVEQYRRAVQEEPDNTAYRIAFERAMLSASVAHLDRARVLEARGQLEEALREYRRANEFDPANRQIAAKVLDLERQLRDLAEAAKPRPSVQQLRDAARQGAAPPPLFGLDTVLQPLRFQNSSVRTILDAIAQATAINIQYERDFQDRTYSVTLENVTLEEALQQILAANGLFYKVVNQRTILVIPDNAQKRGQYEDQVIQTFHISHVDPLELAQAVNTIMRLPGQAQAPPTVFPNKATNTITVRATAGVMAIIERLIDTNDKPRAEVLVDVQILEVLRNRAKQFGLDLGTYALTAVFSPEVDPRTDDGLRAPSFNANTISRGISTNDFYLSVPSAIVRFLESDTDTKVIAKPQLRGAEGVVLRLNLGEEIPVPSTSFTPLAQGGANFNPLTSFQYRNVGLKIEMTPRVSFEGEITLDLYVENSTLGGGIVIAGQEYPTFGSRNVTTRLRLREGESSLLAGLLREDDRRILTGFPGLLRIPVIKQLFSANNTQITQTDIIMLLTPRIVRTHELTPGDVAPIFIGTSTNMTLGGAPPLLTPPDAAPVAGAEPGAPAAPAPVVTPGVTPPPVAPAVPPPAPAAGAPPAAGAQQPPGVPGAGGVAVLPPGSSPIPGTTTVPSAAVSTPGAAATGQILVSPPAAEFRVGGGPYTVPISISGASQLSSITLTVTFNPTALRIRGVQEGSFMRTGGVAAVFTQQVDAASGRLDIAIVRPGDVTGVAGTGLLAALLFDAIGEGPGNIAVSASASAPGGAPVTLQFAPVPLVNVR
jgi:Flp pilus assembly secretin CpaC